MNPRGLLVLLLALGCTTAPAAPTPTTNSSGAAETQQAAARDAGPTLTDDAATDAATPAARTSDGGSGAAAGLYRQAMAAFERDDIQNAARLFAEAHAQSPSVELAFNAARAYERLGDVANGTRFYQLVLDGSPPPALRADVTARMASLRDFDRRSREGFAQLPPGRDDIAREAMTWFQRGTTAFRAGRYQVALQAFEAARQYNDTIPELAFNLAMTHERMHHRDEAIAGFHTYLGLRPDAPDRARIEERIRALQH